MGLVFLGCPHSVWGLLLLFAAIQMFVSLVHVPATITVFQGAVEIRTALYTMEQKAAAVDAGMTYFPGDSSGLTATDGAVYSNVIDPITNDTTTTSYSPASAVSAQLEYLQSVRTVWDAITLHSTIISRLITRRSPTQVFAPRYVTTNYPTDTVYSIYLSSSSNWNFINDGTNYLGVPGASGTAPKAVRTGIDSTVEDSFGNAGINENAAKMFTAAVTSAMIREELFAAFFSFQTIMSVVFFFYVMKCFKTDTAPTAGPGMAIFGLIGFFAAYSTTFTNFNLVGVNFLMTNYWITSSGIGTYFANPYLALLNLTWPLNVVYSLYSTKHND